MNRLSIACLFLMLTVLSAKADSCSSAVPGARVGPNPESINWTYGDACYISWPGGYIDGKNARFALEPKCQQIPGFLEFIGDQGSNVNTCIFKPLGISADKPSTTQPDTRNDYEYHERPPARDTPEPYRAPTFVPPSPPPTQTYETPAPNSSNDDGESERDDESEFQKYNERERAVESERRRDLENRAKRLQEQAQQQQEIQRTQDPPRAKKWRAIAVTIESNTFSPDRSAAGESYGYDAQDKARFRALQECRKQQVTGCVVEFSWDRGCHYLVLSNGSNRATWGSGPTIAQARNNCRFNRGGQNCSGRTYGGCEPND
ncbi:DUF4189 domain-containing protein [Methylobacterium thuringiense]|uniref:DUF4189 domain-containing protein n=1 Tax=Methylobacterium thuringiense TaxID=1003091 RepID=A0ABQ4TSK1_9HYPH|nr:DUF4189 domain-containing protein [Methylobacterium thuringiense]GJE57379.1 hypothetical protein EKPJFOCH_3893 [Methylobacterium thuringiense]